MYDPEYITYAEERGEQIHEDRLDDLRRCEALLDAAQEHEDQLEQILDACEAANAKYLARIDHLEGLYWKMWGENEKLRELCRDMFTTVDSYCVTVEDRDRYFARMEQLGLIHETEYDPDTGLRWGEQND